jgi:4-hydroxybenzoate polyprenyltransferase
MLAPWYLGFLWLTGRTTRFRPFYCCPCGPGQSSTVSVFFPTRSPLLISCIDTVYACQDKKDDILAGIRSTAILFGQWIRPLLAIFGLLFVGALAFAGFINKQGPAFFGLSVGGTVVHLVWQYFTVDLDDPKSCKGARLTHTLITQAYHFHSQF